MQSLAKAVLQEPAAVGDAAASRLRGCYRFAETGIWEGMLRRESGRHWTWRHHQAANLGAPLEVERCGRGPPESAGAEERVRMRSLLGQTSAAYPICRLPRKGQTAASDSKAGEESAGLTP